MSGRRPRSKEFRAVRIYRRLMVLLPSAFRQTAARELVQVFRDEYEDVRTRGGVGSRFVFWGRALRDLLTVAAVERWPSAAGPAAPPDVTGVSSVLDTARDVRRDLVHAGRRLIRSPGFTLSATAILALGIGANATMFTVVSSLFLEPPPLIPEPDELVRLNRTVGGSGFRALAYADYVYYRDHNEVFEGVYAYDPDGVALSIGVGDAIVPGRGWFVSHNYFDVLGIRPAAGRWFLLEEDQTPSTHPVAVVSHGFWQRNLGGDRTAVGSIVELNGNRFTLVGVAPEGFRGASPIETPPDVWVPIHAQPILSPMDELYAIERIPGNTWVWLWGMGRLKEGVTLEAAQSHMDGLALYLEENFAEWNQGWGVVLSANSRFHPPAGTSLASLTRLLFSVVAVVLLIASANVAILLMARGSAHLRDVSIRAALGAGRGRLVRASLAESLLLAFMGGVVGLVLSYWSAGAVASLAPMDFTTDFTPDARVFAFALALAAFTAGLFGLIPARQASSVDVSAVLKGHGGLGGRSRTRSALVVAQMALSLALVVAAGLFARSLATASKVDLGFEPEGRTLVGVQLRSHGYSPDEGRAFIRDGLRRIGSLPGVRSVATTSMVPFRGSWGTTVSAPGGRGGPDEGEGRRTGADASRLDVGMNAVSSGYFETMGMPILAGRGFTEADGEGQGTHAAVINEALAQRLWPDADPLGRLFGGEDDREPWTVVGVVRDAQYYEIGESPRPHAWVSVLDRYQSRVVFIVDTGGDASVGARARQEILTMDRSLAFVIASSLDAVIGDEIGRYRVAATLVGFFGLLALVLASAGLYGVLSYTVARRVREIGVRVALGASRRLVGRAIVREGLRLAVTGAGLGLLAALAGGRLVSSFLYGVSPRDPVTLVGVPIVLLVIAALASGIPAWRATRIDPMEALRAE